ncbi:hypothetical protein AWRIB418_1669, partial [Oenococcus oeni AWRIB418]
MLVSSAFISFDWLEGAWLLLKNDCLSIFGKAASEDGTSEDSEVDGAGTNEDASDEGAEKEGITGDLVADEGIFDEGVSKRLFSGSVAAEDVFSKEGISEKLSLGATGVEEKVSDPRSVDSFSLLAKLSTIFFWFESRLENCSASSDKESGTSESFVVLSISLKLSVEVVFLVREKLSS